MAAVEALVFVRQAPRRHFRSLGRPHRSPPGLVCGLMDGEPQGAASVISIASGRTVYHALVGGCHAHPDRDLLVFVDSHSDSRAYSWLEVVSLTERVAATLAALGVSEGSFVHIHSSNRPEFLYTWFACSRLGAVLVPTNTQSAPQEIEYILRHSGAQLSIVEEELVDSVANAAALLETAHVVVQLSRLTAEGSSTESLPAYDVAAPDRDLGVLYTSGTTSRPKGVLITEANYIFAGEVFAHNLRLSPSDRVLTVLPLFHANAQYYTVMGALVSRATIVLASRFSARRLMPLISEHRVTVASLFAAPMRMLLAQPEQTGWRDHSLRAVAFAQNLSGEEVDQWSRAIGAPLVQLYGMTETVGAPVVNPLNGETRADTIGRVSLGYTCRVIKDDGTLASVGEIGQLCVHGVPGTTLMRGYLNDPDATADMLRDGWLHTGDVVRVEADGFLVFVDRKKDLIKRAGENVAASEVEAVLRGHPAVVDAAVFGIPDPVRDQAIIAAVVLADGESADAPELLSWCADRLARFRVPNDIVILDRLPRTPVGKVQKHLLAASYGDNPASRAVYSAAVSPRPATEG